MKKLLLSLFTFFLLLSIGGVSAQTCPDADGDGLCDADDNCPTVYNQTQIDNDQDGFGYTCDCDDFDATTHEGAEEVCDGIDNDCDSSVDEGYIPQATTCGIGVCSSFGETFCIAGTVIDSCEPGTPTLEVCDEVDNNCDGAIDEGCPTCTDTDGDGLCDEDDNCPTVYNQTQIDNDQDGFGYTCDCDDFDAGINTDATEICDDRDNNCDGNIDENNNDLDGDSIGSCDDLCEGTMSDDAVPARKLGTNRWEYDENDGWKTKIPAKKKGDGPMSNFTIESTLGCNCEQILDMVTDATGGDFEGHYKWGCSKSVLEDFARDYEDGVIDGQIFVEAFSVNAGDIDGTDTTAVLSSTEFYQITAGGVADAGATIDFDAVCSLTNNAGGDTWTDLVTLYEGYGETLLDLHVDGDSSLWGSTCNIDNTYTALVWGNDTTMNFTIYDIYYPNNIGSLDVEIIVPLY